MPFKSLLDHSRQIRRDQTDAETHRWKHLLDFFAARQKLCVELDGAQHLEEPGARDVEERSSYLAGYGVRVVRFTNSEVLTEIDGVLEKIGLVLKRPSP